MLFTKKKKRGGLWCFFHVKIIKRLTFCLLQRSFVVVRKGTEVRGTNHTSRDVRKRIGMFDRGHRRAAYRIQIRPKPAPTFWFRGTLDALYSCQRHGPQWGCCRFDANPLEWEKDSVFFFFFLQSSFSPLFVSNFSAPATLRAFSGFFPSCFFFFRAHFACSPYCFRRHLVECNFVRASVCVQAQEICRFKFKRFRRSRCSPF